MRRFWFAIVVLVTAAGPAGAQIPDLLAIVCEEAGACPAQPTCDFPATGQTRQVVAGEDGNPAYGGALAYVDDGDGMITDLNTGLVWEKKIRRDGTPVAADLHDADNCYPWRGSCPASGAECGTDADCPVGETCDTSDCQTGAPNGMTIFEWVAALNDMGFAGHDDWRIPNVKELQSIVDYGPVSPAVDPAFHGASCGAGCADITSPACSCTAPFSYWSATNLGSFTTDAWSVGFSTGNVNTIDKGNDRWVRAVRGGS